MPVSRRTHALSLHICEAGDRHLVSRVHRTTLAATAGKPRPSPGRPADGSVKTLARSRELPKGGAVLWGRTRVCMPRYLQPEAVRPRSSRCLCTGLTIQLMRGSCTSTTPANLKRRQRRSESDFVSSVPLPYEWRASPVLCFATSCSFLASDLTLRMALCMGSIITTSKYL
jgi:hypothetical protein